MSPRKRASARAAAPPSRTPDLYRVAGGVMLAWFAVNTAVSAVRYGIDQGVYWWFCNLAMFGVGLALWNRHRGWMLAFLSIASFTQSFWIFDNLWRIAAGTNLLGLVEFMYQPGNPWDEFLLSHYHFFILPTGILGLLLIKERKEAPVGAVVATNAFIFGMSYFVFPKEQNVNCIHEPCVPSIEHWGGPLYSWLFFCAVCAGCLTVMRLATWALDRWKLKARGRALAVRAYAAVVIAALGLTALDVQEKARVPEFTCADPADDGTVRAGCRYTLEHAPGVLAFVYRLENRAPEAQLCKTYLEHGGKRELLEEDVHVAPGAHRDRRTLLAYPRSDTKARVSAECVARR